MASSPRILNRPTGTDQTPRYAKARLAVHHRCACSGLKALRNTSAARRQAAKLCYRFGPLTPSARSANLIVGDRTRNGFPAPNKEPATNQKHDLTGKAPYRFESISLQRRVCCEPVFLGLIGRPAPSADLMAGYGTEQPVHLAVDAVGEVEDIGTAVAAADPKLDRPQAARWGAARVDRDRSMQLSVAWDEGVNFAMEKAEVADQHIIAEAAETRW